MTGSQKIISEHAELFQVLNKGVIVRISEALYEHFLNVLPPITMGPGFYVFGEGTDRIRFWKEADTNCARYVRTSVYSSNYECFIDVIFDPKHQVYNVISSHGIDDATGKTFGTIEAAAQALGLQIR